MCYYLASKLKSIWLCKNPQKRRIVVQNGRQNKVVVITYAMVSIEHAVVVKKTCHGIKKGGTAKINSSESAMK